MTKFAPNMIGIGIATATAVSSGAVSRILVSAHVLG
jgi:hypothetical protein